MLTVKVQRECTAIDGKLPNSKHQNPAFKLHKVLPVCAVVCEGMKRLKKRDTLRSAPCRLAKEPQPDTLRRLIPVTSEKASSSLSPFKESKLA